MRNLILSYDLNSKRKYYRGRQISIERAEKPSDSYFGRESRLSFSSHAGTHIDFPAHFLKNGRYGNEYPCDYLFSDKVSVIHTGSLTKNRLRLEDIDFERISGDAEILLIKTGYCNIRDDDAYWAESPVISSEIPLELKKRFPQLKAAAFDVISVKSLSDADEGIKCHLNFLSEQGGRSVLIIEDADLRLIEQDVKIKSIKIIPLVFEQMEGTPCSIIAEI